MEKYVNEKHDEYLNLGFNRAKASLNHFFDLLSLPLDILNHLYDIDIVIDYDNEEIKRIFIDGEEKDNAIAFYKVATERDEDKIFISCDYIDSLLIDLEEDIKTRQDVINEIALTIIHELLHRNRTIIIKNAVNQEEAYIQDKYNEMFKNYDISKYKDLLDQSITSGFYNYFDVFVPLTSIIKGNNKYDVVAYNKSNDTFCMFNNQEFGTLDINDMSLLKIGIELNTKDIIHNHDEVIPYKNSDYEEEYFGAASDYYHQSGESITTRDERLQNQIYLEESLVEILARLILNTRKSKEINLEKFESDIFRDSSIKDNEYLAGKMLTLMGIPTIKWFILSGYQDEYDDKLYKAFNDKYNLLLEYFKNIMTGKNVKESIDDINEIYNEKIR